MDDETVVRRKDGRPLVTEYPLSWQDMVEIHTGLLEIPEDAIVCRFKSREPAYEAWMDDI